MSRASQPPDNHPTFFYVHRLTCSLPQQSQSIIPSQSHVTPTAPIAHTPTKTTLEPASDSKVSPRQYTQFTCIILKKYLGPFFAIVQPSPTFFLESSIYLVHYRFIDTVTSSHHPIIQRKSPDFSCSYPSDRSEDPPSVSRSYDANAETRSLTSFLYACVDVPSRPSCGVITESRWASGVTCDEDLVRFAGVIRDRCFRHRIASSRLLGDESRVFASWKTVCGQEGSGSRGGTAPLVI